MRACQLVRAASALAIVGFVVTPAVAQAVCSGISKTSNTQLQTVAVVDGLVNRPVFVTSPPGDRNRLFILEQEGYIRIHKRGDDPSLFSTFLNISSKVNANPALNEMGLLGLAFDPNYATNGFFYVNYTESSNPFFGPHFSVVARYQVSAGNPDQANAASEVRLLRFSQPETNHNGGWMAFGPDNYLYISSGDGGGGNDNHGTCGNGQITTTMLGKILRIDPSSTPSNRPPDCVGTLINPPYRIPADNPLVGVNPATNCEEVYAWGLRNPWRPSFDRSTGDFYIADVGQNCWEEVNFNAAGAAKGRNFGWREMEGRKCFNIAQATNCNPSPSTGCPKTCNDPTFTLPVLDYSHGEGCSITGGYSYRGCRMKNFPGTYFYSDYCQGWVRSFKISGGTVTDPRDWSAQLFPAGQPTNAVVSYGEDAEGENYIVLITGDVLLIAPPFTDLEVSGTGAADAFLLTKTRFSWENLARSSQQPIAEYRVYRSDQGNGTFLCVFKNTAPEWIGGDPAKPLTGSSFFYLVTATNAAGQQASPGAGRVLSAAPCP